MTVLDAFSPLSVVFDRDADQIWDCPTISEEKLQEYMKDLRKSQGEIHSKIETSVKSFRATKWRNANKKSSAVKFDKGDYVLVAVAEPQNISKLQPRWNGSDQITEVVSYWVLVVKLLVSKAEKTVHASRLQFYSDKDLNVTIRLQEQIQHDEWKCTVESFKDFREEGKEYQVLTQWLGIDEPVWEPMDIMCPDVPKL